MKKTLLVASLLVLGTSAMATDVQGFVGAGLGVSWNKLTKDWKFTDLNESGKASERKSSFHMGFKGGVILDSSHRLALNYNPTLYKNATVHNILASYDYLIPINNENRLYAGVHAGNVSFKGKKDLDGVSMNGFAYGLQAGYIYDITKNVEFEFGAMYTKHNAKKTYKGEFEGFKIEEKFKFKDSISTLVGINYKF